jgi:hypothetical protein
MLLTAAPALLPSAFALLRGCLILAGVVTIPPGEEDGDLKPLPSRDRACPDLHLRHVL